MLKKENFELVFFTTFPSWIFKNNTIFRKPTTSSFHWFLFHLSIFISSEDIAKSEKKGL